MSDAPNGLVTQAEYARLRGVSRQAINELVSSGKIPLVDGKIDVAVADSKVSQLDMGRSKLAQAAGQTGDVFAGGDGDAGDTDRKQPAPASEFQVARTLRESVEARRSELALKRELGEVVDREKVERAISEVGRMLRDTLLGMPVRVAPQLAHMTDPREIILTLEQELRRALEDSAKLLRAGLDRVQH